MIPRNAYEDKEFYFWRQREEDRRQWKADLDNLNSEIKGLQNQMRIAQDFRESDSLQREIKSVYRQVGSVISNRKY